MGLHVTITLSFFISHNADSNFCHNIASEALDPVLNAPEYSFVIEYFCQKRVVLRLHSCVIGWTWKNYELTFGQWLFTSTHTLLELWVAKAVTLHCGKSERHFRPRSWGWCNLSRVKSTSSYFQCNLLFIFFSVTICSTSPQINHSIYCLRTNQFRKKQQNSPDPCQLKTKNSCQ